MARHLPEPEPTCYDCGTDRFVDPETGHYIEYSLLIIVRDKTSLDQQIRTFCAPCYRWRQKRLAEFDERRRPQIEAIDEHTEVFARR